MEILDARMRRVKIIGRRGHRDLQLVRLPTRPLHLPAKRQAKPNAVTYKNVHKDGWKYLSIFITPQCYKIIRQYLPGREGGGGVLHRTQAGNQLLLGQAPAFSNRSQSPLPLLPPACMRSQPVADSRQPTASCVPARTHSRALVRVSALRAMPRLALPLSLSLFCCLPHLSPLSSQAEPNVLPNPRKEMPLVPSSPLWVSRFFSVSFSPDP